MYKVEKIKEGLIHNAKVKRAYYRTLKREEKAGTLPSLLDSATEARAIDSSDIQQLGGADLQTLHSSRLHRLIARPNGHENQFAGQENLPDKAKKIALAEERRQEKERNEKERVRKIKLREKKRKDLRKRTKWGQPVMKTRMEDLLGKVKKVMKGD